MTKAERSTEVVTYADDAGDRAACEKFSVTMETIRRYRRLLREDGEQIQQPISRVLQDIGERYTDGELRAIASGGYGSDDRRTAVDAGWFDGEVLRFAAVTDTHIGSLYFREDWWNTAVEQILAADVNFVCHVGDISEGMSNRPGHVYELAQIGYSEQRDESVKQLRKLNGLSLYCIDGNHDRWFIKSNGARIVEDVCVRLDNAEFIGHDVGEILVQGIKIQLWHGEDGSSYAHSYRLQKVIEALPGGGKPNILLTGHVHKMAYFFERNIHALSCGCFQEQTPWMRGKRLGAHPGFWIVEATIHDGSVTRLVPAFHAYY